MSHLIKIQAVCKFSYHRARYCRQIYKLQIFSVSILFLTVQEISLFSKYASDIMELVKFPKFKKKENAGHSLVAKLQTLEKCRWGKLCKMFLV